MRLLYSISISLLLVLLCLTLPLHADPVDIVGSGAWQSTNSSQFTGSGGIYFDNESGDPPGLDVNLAEYLFSQGFLTGNAYYWGDGGGFDSSMLFDVPSGSMTITILTEIASQADNNVFGWFELSGGIPVLNPLFLGPDSAGATVQFAPASPFGFYLISQGDTFYSVASESTSDTGFQHFAVMTQSPGSSTIFLGVEDSISSASDRDFNDFVVQITVPEPATLVLLLVALGTVSLGTRRNWV